MGLRPEKPSSWRVIETDAIFAETPAEIDVLIVNARGKVQQADVEIFHHAAGGLNLLERRADGFFGAIAFQTSARSPFVGNHQAAGALDSFREGVQLFFGFAQFAARLHRVDQDGLELGAQTFGFGE